MPQHKEKIAFIVNPISGAGKNHRFENYIQKYLDTNKFIPEIIYTKKAGEAPELAKKQIEDGFKIIVAVGGDGTINEVAGALAHTDAIFGIIPRGSGNGLARHLGIPLKLAKAFDVLNHMNIEVIDYGKINDKAFFCTAGLGFDALIGWEFAHAGSRGFFTYFKKTVTEFFSYKPEKYTIQTNGAVYKKNAFLVTFANASQYGNNAYIAPKASVKDGILDIIIFKPFPLIAAFSLAIRLFLKRIDESKYIEVIKASECKLIRSKEGYIHFDGEPGKMGNEIEVRIFRKALKVLVSQKNI